MSRLLKIAAVTLAFAVPSAAQAAPPDLVILKAAVVTNVAGVPGYVRVLVRNQGMGPSLKCPLHLWVYEFKGGKVTKFLGGPFATNVPALAVGQTTWVTIATPVTLSPQRLLRLFVDPISNMFPQGLNKESLENNNTYQLIMP